MESPEIYALASVALVSVISLVGLIAISLKEEKLHKIILLLVALAVGALLGDSFIHLIPEALEGASNPSLVSLLIIAGIIATLVLERILHIHHDHHKECEGPDCTYKEPSSSGNIKPVGTMILYSDGMHNFVDGILIGASYLISIEIGIATTLAVMLHEIPQEIGDFGVLLYAGYKKSRALLLNFVSALSAFLGVILVLIIGRGAEELLTWIIPITAGTFIYIASVDLMPILHKEMDRRKVFFQITAIIIGVLLMYALTLVEVG